MRYIAIACVGVALVLPGTGSAATATILGWNNLGMHCMDSDYSVFSILPPYNTIESQLIVGGSLVTNGAGYRVTYQAQADASGSFNSTAMGKGNFYTYAGALYGAANLPSETGLLGWKMPGLGNQPQAMLFEVTNSPAQGVSTPVNWFRAEGIPISPYDDAHLKNPYPLMRMIAWSGTQAIATNDVVLPVSDEMDCRACHASGTQVDAKPAAGWVWDGLPERDYRLNILRLHDERQFASHKAVYVAALADRKFNPQGLYRSVTIDNNPVLCAACHASEALGAPSYPTVPPLTASVHAFHASVMDPVLNTTLNDSANRAACYRCHPGSTTRCLRGAMGGAIAADGSMEMQCQSCHGNMSQVGAATRVGWFMEPNCQACHTGTATHNNGQIRYTSAFTNTATAGLRLPVDQTFATQPDVPAAGLSLYRFSAGHGGLQCSACHGSTHAEFPSTHANDNVRNQALQGHAGMMVECEACHTVTPNSPNGGPHGMHAIGQGWVTGTDAVTKHADQISALGGVTACQPCHGTDYRGTVLSRAQAARTLTASFDTNTVTLNLFRGAQIGCYNCHDGPFSSAINASAAPAVSNLATNTTNNQPLTFPLAGTGVNLAWRIILQPANGSVGLDPNTGLATYFPNAGFVGTDQFTFAAFDGSKNSNLGTGTVAVAQGPFTVGVAAQVPPSYPQGWLVPFAAVPSVTNQVAVPVYDWNFGDGAPHGSGQHAEHVYAAPGNYHWSVSVNVAGAIASTGGAVAITGPMQLVASHSGSLVSLSWPNTLVDAVLEGTGSLAGSPQWLWITNTPSSTPGLLSLTLPASGNEFFRLRRPW